MEISFGSCPVLTIFVKVHTSVSFCIIVEPTGFKLGYGYHKRFAVIRVCLPHDQVLGNHTLWITILLHSFHNPQIIDSLIFPCRIIPVYIGSDHSY